jgi:hypothetical protein
MDFLSSIKKIIPQQNYPMDFKSIFALSNTALYRKHLIPL